MPELDLCIAGSFSPGSRGATSGLPPVQPGVPSLLDPEDYAPDSVTYTHDFSKFYNAATHHRRVR